MARCWCPKAASAGQPVLREVQGPAALGTVRRRNGRARDRVPPLAAGVTIFRQRILQAGVVEHRIGMEPLELGVLVFESLQPLRVGDAPTAVLRLPGAERPRRHAVLAAEIGDLRACIKLPQQAKRNRKDSMLKPQV